MSDQTSIGRVTLVGSGPGDPDLLTIAALREIQTADVILYDDLVSQEIMALANPETKRIHVGKRGYRPSCKQPEINQLIVTLAFSGLNVVRLKSGDALIFGRAGEEIEVCRRAGIEVKIIPGVTSAQGAAASLLTSLTHRNYARRLQFITGHDRESKIPEGMNWNALADKQATTVVYMPLRTIRELTAKIMAHGLPSDTPATAIVNATRKNEHIVRCSVSSMADELEKDKPTGPVLVMIGRVFENT